MNPILAPLLVSLRARIASDPNLKERELLSLVRPSIRLATKRTLITRIAIGESSIGGVPDVPPGFEWPRWAPAKTRPDACGEPWNPGRPVPLAFIAQINLRELPQVDDIFPRSGWLYFFYDRYCEPWGFDPADRGCFRIIYTNCDRSSLSRAAPPSDANPEHVAKPCSVEALVELTLPDELPALSYGDPAFESYRTLCDEMTSSGGLRYHHLIGYPQQIQSPMELECQLVSNGINCGDSTGYKSDQAIALSSGASEWRLLLQIDDDEDGPGWSWCGGGRIYFWIKQKDLASLRFDDVWVILQTT